MDTLKTLLIAARSLLFATGFATLWGWLALGMRRYDAQLGARLPDVPLAGIAVMIAGALIAISCIGTFVVRGRGTPAPFDAPRRFVAEGPYRYVRNPMYIGGFLALIGFGLYERSAAILLFSCGFVLLTHVFVIGYEEPTLREKFGEAYLRYCATVHRWIPRRTNAPGG
ncbi:MAG: methyltransferase family protein [Bryobacteraceae bacterium]